MTRRLNLKRMNASSAMIGINDASHMSMFKVAATIKSRVHDCSLNIDFFALPNLTSKLPLMTVNLKGLKIPADISLADPVFHVPKKVDIILGAEIYFELLIKEQMKPTPRGPIYSSGNSFRMGNRGTDSRANKSSREVDDIGIYERNVRIRKYRKSNGQVLAFGGGEELRRLHIRVKKVQATF